MLNASVEQSDAEKTLQDEMLFADQRLSQLMVPRKGLCTIQKKQSKIKVLQRPSTTRAYHRCVPIIKRWDRISGALAILWISENALLER